MEVIMETRDLDLAGWFGKPEPDTPDELDLEGVFTTDASTSAPAPELPESLEGQLDLEGVFPVGVESHEVAARPESTPLDLDEAFGVDGKPAKKSELEKFVALRPHHRAVEAAEDLTGFLGLKKKQRSRRRSWRDVAPEDEPINSAYFASALFVILSKPLREALEEYWEWLKKQGPSVTAETIELISEVFRISEAIRELNADIDRIVETPPPSPEDEEIHKDNFSGFGKFRRLLEAARNGGNRQAPRSAKIARRRQLHEERERIATLRLERERGRWAKIRESLREFAREREESEPATAESHLDHVLEEVFSF